MKKIIVVLLIALFLVNCGKQENPTSGSETLTVWCWDPSFNIYAMQVAADIYQRDNPNVNIVIENTSIEQVQAKLIAALSSGQTANLPDIVLLQDANLQKNLFTFPNAFLPLNDQIDFSQFVTSKAAFGEYEGRNYSLPFDSGATGTFLRTDIIEQAGLTVADFTNITWEHFFEQAKVVKAKTGVTMISAYANSPDIPLMMMVSSGVWFFDNDGKITIQNNAVLKRALELYVKAVREGDVMIINDQAGYIATLTRGNVASSVYAGWLVGSLVAEKSQAGKWAVTTTPRLEGFNSVNASSEGGSSWLVMANSKHPDRAIDFLAKTFAGSIELYDTILPASGAIATWLPATASPVYAQGHPFFGGQAIFADLVRYSTQIPRVKYGAFNHEARDAIARNMSALVAGTLTVDNMLAQTQKEVEFLQASIQ